VAWVVTNASSNFRAFVFWWVDWIFCGSGLRSFLALQIQGMGDPVNDQELMQKIKGTYSAALAEINSRSSIPEAFLAAMIANESGGNNNAKRFEPGVLSSLWQVLLGRKATYGSIQRANLVGFVTDLPQSTVTVPPTITNEAFQNLDSLASSWGATQIMGWHCLEEHAPFARPEDLTDEFVALKATVWLLGKFAAQFSLDLSSDFSDLLHCWNAGAPNHPTFDPNYVPNALARMDIYKALP
jgi:hypothetical protein